MTFIYFFVVEIVCTMGSRRLLSGRRLEAGLQEQYLACDGMNGRLRFRDSGESEKA
jgi:hypothetical protein